MKTTKKEIIVDSKDIKLSEIIGGSDNSALKKIVAITLLNDKIATAKEIVSKYTEVQKSLTAEIQGKPYKAIIDEMVADGSLTSDEEKPVIVVKLDEESAYQISLSDSIDKAFSISADLKAPSIIDILDPKYVTTKVTKTLNEKEIKAEFEEGSLPEDLATYCSCSPTPITRITKKKISLKEGE